MEELYRAFDNIEVELTDNQANDFRRYFELMLEYNKIHNLTTITEWSDVCVKHFADSVLGARYIPLNSTVLDIGAGAGFPSIPLKLIRPDLKIVMLDSVNKKVEFLKQVVDELHLTDVSAIHARIEEVTNMRDSFNVVVARAVAPLNTLLEYCVPYVRIGGVCILYKGSNCEEELAASTNAMKVLNTTLISAESITLTPDIKRCILVLNKDSATSARYPRQGNKPRTQPL